MGGTGRDLGPLARLADYCPDPMQAAATESQSGPFAHCQAASAEVHSCSGHPMVHKAYNIYYLALSKKNADPCLIDYQPFGEFAF